jgi:hypothetical protein
MNNQQRADTIRRIISARAKRAGLAEIDAKTITEIGISFAEATGDWLEAITTQFKLITRSE